MEELKELKDKLKYLIIEVEKRTQDHKRLLDNIKKYRK
jgi:hypothetical protein